MKLIIIALSLGLTACATPPRFLAELYDSNDKCQRQVKPDWCGSSGPTYVTRDYRTGNYLTTTKAQK